MNPSELVRLIQKDPAPWLWSTSVRVELFALLAKLWDSVGDRERKMLVDVILAGPQHEIPDDGTRPEETTRYRERAIWERLVRLSHANEPLSSKALTVLDDLQKKYPKWQLSGSDQDDFPAWTEFRWGYETDVNPSKLAGMSPGELLDLLGSDSRYKSGRLSSWKELVAERSQHALPVFNEMQKSDRSDADILDWTFRGIDDGLDDLVEDPEAIAMLVAIMKRIIDRASDVEFKDFAYSFARVLEKLLPIIQPELFDEALALWDKTLPLTLNVTPVATTARLRGEEIPLDLLTQAINQPTGNLVRALFEVLRLMPDDEQELPLNIRVRLEHLLGLQPGEVDQSVITFIRVIVCMHTSLLYWFDPDWAQKWILPLFDWANPEIAIAAWEGFLQSPHIGPDLWERLHPHIIESFGHYDELSDDRRKRLPAIIVQAYVRGFPIGNNEIASSLRQTANTDKFGLSVAAQTVNKLLDGAEDKAGQLWRDKINPFFQEAWPRDEYCKSSLVTHEIIQATIHIQSDDFFPEAIETILPLVASGNDPQFLRISLKQISDSELPDRHAVETFFLLKKIIPQNARLGKSALGDILQRIENSGSKISEKDQLALRHLKDASRVGG